MEVDMKLKPCPWCGKKPEREVFCGCVRIHCNCELKPCTGVYLSDKKAIEAWNTRKED
jgi:hypothetical protein